MRKLKIGMISFAHPHAASYLDVMQQMPEVEVIGISDEDYRRVEQYVEPCGIPYYEDYHDLLATDADAVIVCSENVKHASITIDAANAKKHVLCEKPLGIARGEMQRMIEVCKLNGVQLMTAFPNRYIPMVLQAKESIERGEIGEILAVKATNKGAMPGGWFVDRTLSGGGAVLDHTVHVADILNWILNSKVIEVYAESGTLFHPIDIDDAGMVHIQYDNGVAAVIDTSWSRGPAFPYKRDLTLEFVGEHGIISIDYFAQTNEVYSNTKSNAEWSYWGDNKDELLVNDFVHKILNGQAVSITGEDGYRAASVALAAYESIRSGKPVQI